MTRTLRHFKERRRRPRLLATEGPLHDRVLDMTSKDRALRGRRAIRTSLQQIQYLSRRTPSPAA